MKLHKSIFVLLAVLILLLTQTTPAVAAVCGDINNDGTVNIADLVYLVEYMFQSGPPPPQMYTTDVNGDGSAYPDIADLVYLVEYMFQSGPEPICPTGTVVIDISPDALNAPWSLTGPDSYSTSGTGDETLIELTPGDYTISWGAVSGWITPSNSTQTLAANETVTFSGTYVQEAGTVVIDISPDTLNAPWSLAGPNSYSASGIGDETLAELTPGDYTITWGTVSGWITPLNSTQTLAANGILTFNGTYLETSTVTDIDGNVYQTVTIGTQVWMMENLKVTHYRNGDAIPNVTSSTTWGSLYTGAYCNYNNDVNNVATYGRLYNWYAVADSRNIAPTGWHVPSDAEWQTLVDYLGGDLVAGGKMKEVGTTHWAYPNTGATNESGFTALPGGDRLDGGFGDMGYVANIWSSTEDGSSSAWSRYLDYYNPCIGPFNDLKQSGFSVRCVKDTYASVVIDVSPDLLNAPWSLAGPDSYSASGTGNETLTELTPGDYTITWGAVSGWITPSNSTQTLAANGTVTFSGTYVQEIGTVTDIDGNVYQTVTIGTQVWMMENLKVTHYRNGEAIPNVTDGTAWYYLTTGAYCDYNNDVINVAVYGRLYNWYAVADSRNIAPEGWHVPSDAEWQTLVEYLGGDLVAGGRMKEVGTTHWIYPNTGATNESGFTALPGGSRSSNGYFDLMGKFAYFWSSTEYGSGIAWNRHLYYNYSGIYRVNYYNQFGFSVRCVRD